MIGDMQARTLDPHRKALAIAIVGAIGFVIALLDLATLAGWHILGLHR